MPQDNIERAVKKGTGELEGVTLAEIVLEGYGPGGTAILVNALTDNRNRTVQEVRSTFSRHNGSLGESGCVAWLFDSRGVITVDTGKADADALALAAIDAGAEDVKVESGYVEVYTLPMELEKVRQALEKQGVKVSSAEIIMVPKTLVALDEKNALTALKLVEKLEEIDGVQHVASNADFPDSVLEEYQSQRA